MHANQQNRQEESQSTLMQKPLLAHYMAEQA